MPSTVRYIAIVFYFYFLISHNLKFSHGVPRVLFKTATRSIPSFGNLATIIIIIFSVFTPPEFTITGRKTIEIVKKSRISGRKPVPKGGNYEKNN